MGFLDSLARFFGIHKKEAKILIIGLDNSGKSTLINKLKPSNSQKKIIIPTIGFSVEKCETKELVLTCFDMAGQGRYRNLWEHYYGDCDAIIFVIDSCDTLRLVVAQDELEAMLSHPKLQSRQIPLLFFANKMDIQGALTSGEIAQTLALDKIRNKQWSISASNALTGEGLNGGIDWLLEQLKTTIKKR